MSRTLLPTFSLALTLAACSAQTGAEADAPPPELTSRNAIKLHLGDAWREVTAENYAEQMSARSFAYDEMEFKPIGLAGVECGDNCYLLYNPKVEGGGDATALCSAPVCAEWFASRALPDDMRLRGALAKFRKGTQVDGAGNVMSTDYAEITKLRLDPQ